ncbi:MAG: T9SS type A sorting domain-containing protein [Chitinophagales bacterium]|nr:T9SS type A sorting domain-containing protein [Chitinophagales bacterium]
MFLLKSCAIVLCAIAVNVHIAYSKEEIQQFIPCDSFTVSISSIDASCISPGASYSNGIITVNPSGGNPPYSYLWDSASGDQTNSTATGLSAGVYSVIITDDSGCIFTAYDTVSIEPDQHNPLCFILSTTLYLDTGGIQTLKAETVDGGSFDKCSSVSLSLSQTIFSCSDVPGKAVTLTVTDSSGNQSACQSTIYILDTFNVCPPPCNNPYIVQIIESELSCPGESDGALEVIYTGTSTYSFKWSDPSGQTTSLATGLSAAKYIVTVTDKTDGSCASIGFEAVKKGIDDTPPVLSCLDSVIVVDADFSCEAFVTVPSPTISDNCSYLDTCALNDFNNTCNASGNYESDTTIVTFTARDSAGNIGSCTNTVVLLNFISDDILTWTGNVNSDWSTLGNWSPCGIPDSNTICIIPNVADSLFDPIVNNLAHANKITLEDGSNLAISDSGVLHVLHGSQFGIRLRSSATLKNDGLLRIDDSGGDAIKMEEDNATLLNNGDLIITNNRGSGINASETSTTITNNGSIFINSTEIGHGIVADGIFTNNGDILLENIAKEGILMDHGHFTNNLNATIEISNLIGGIGIYNKHGLFENYGSIEIDSVINDYSVRNLEGTFINYMSASIVVSNNITDAVWFNEKILTENYGSITILKSLAGPGIDNRKNFVNGPSSSLIISDTKLAGIDNNSTFTNDGYIEILISDNNGIENGEGDYFLNNNQIYINRDTADQTGNGFGLLNKGIFENTSLLHIDLDNTKGIYNDGDLLNRLCGIIYINDTLINDDLIINDALIITGPNTVVINDGEIINNGEILDPYGAFDSIGGQFINNGVIGTSIDTSKYHTDGDNDGFKECRDCNDADSMINPGVSEICKSTIDMDCDGITNIPCFCDFIPENHSASNFVIAGSRSKARLSYGSTPDAISYTINGGILGSSESSWVEITTTDTLFNVKNLSEICYVWRVRANCPDTTSAWSSIDTFCIPSCQPPPNLQAVVNGSTVTFSWDQAIGSIGYLFEATVDPGNFNNAYRDTITPGSSTSLTIPNVPPGNYKWRILTGCSVNPLRLSDYSGSQFFTVNSAISKTNISSGNNWGVRIFPNPASDILNIIFNRTEMFLLEVFDMTGKRILSSSEFGAATSIDISDFRSGIYLVNIVSEDQVFTEKLVISKNLQK